MHLGLEQLRADRLICVAPTMADEFQEFIAGLLLLAKNTKHFTGNGHGILPFYSPHGHTKMAGFHNNAHPMRLEFIVKSMGNLDR